MNFLDINQAIHLLGFDPLAIGTTSDREIFTVTCLCPCGNEESFVFRHDMSMEEMRSAAIDHIREDIKIGKLPKHAIYGRKRPEWTYPVDWSISTNHPIEEFSNA